MAQMQQMLLTASKQKCRSIWVSYGIANVLYLFLRKVKVFSWQQLNRFHYESAISRVQTRINVI